MQDQYRVINYQAAWVPDDDPTRDWNEAAELAVEWVERECARQEAGGLLVTNAFGVEESVPALASFAKRHAHTTPRSSRRIGPGEGPVLAYVPTPPAFRLAARRARNSSLCVVEGFLFPLNGWAVEAQALDLPRGVREHDSRDPRLQKELERIMFNGNNGWTRGFGQDRTNRILTDLHRDGLLDQTAVLGYMAAHGASDHGIERLRKLIEKITAPTT